MNQQNQYQYQQNFQPNLPPRPPRTWWQRHGLLVGILGGTVLLLSLGIWFAVSAANKLTDGFGKATGGFMEAATTIQEDANQYEYDNLYTICNTDSVRFATYRLKIDQLKTATNEVSAEVHRQHLGFSDTLKKEEAGLFSGMLITKAFFIKTGRASKLRIMIENYTKTALRITGEKRDVLDNEFYSTLPVDEDSYANKNWDRKKFTEQPLQAKVALAAVINDLRDFESKRLDALLLEMESIQYGDSTNAEK